MKHLYLRSKSLKRLLSIGQRSKPPEEEATEETESITTDAPESPQRPSWRCFSYEELHEATNGFHKDNLVGRGGYSDVYRGALGDGRAVAVKRLKGAAACERKARDFLAELGAVGHARHANVCALRGCCVDRGLYLLFDLSARGSVSANLHNEKSAPMAWKVRHGIAVGTARGLQYLHKGCKRRIIHRDIKASNILLTEDFQPQISDFGLAKWLPSEWTHRAIAPIEGTFGCLAPEYYTHGIVDEKTDVFAFGVFLLEVVSGRKPVDGGHRSLLSWARPYLKDGRMEALVGPRIGSDYDAEQLMRAAFVASLCIRASAISRPSMTEVVELLDGVEIPQDRWLMPEEEGEEEELWGLDDLDVDDESYTPSSSSSTLSA